MEAIKPQVDERLKQLVEKIERLEEEKAEVSKQISEVYNDAKATGYDIKIMRKLIKEKKRDRAEREEEAYLLATYSNALQLKLFGNYTF